MRKARRVSPRLRLIRYRSALRDLSSGQTRSCQFHQFEALSIVSLWKESFASRRFGMMMGDLGSLFDNFHPFGYHPHLPQLPTAVVFRILQFALYRSNSEVLRQIPPWKHLPFDHRTRILRVCKQWATLGGRALREAVFIDLASPSDVSTVLPVLLKPAFGSTSGKPCAEDIRRLYVTGITVPQAMNFCQLYRACTNAVTIDIELDFESGDIPCWAVIERVLTTCSAPSIRSVSVLNVYDDGPSLAICLRSQAWQNLVEFSCVNNWQRYVDDLLKLACLRRVHMGPVWNDDSDWALITKLSNKQEIKEIILEPGEEDEDDGDFVNEEDHAEGKEDNLEDGSETRSTNEEDDERLQTELSDDEENEDDWDDCNQEPITAGLLKARLLQRDPNMRQNINWHIEVAGERAIWW